jgi:hypothetical protein
MTITPDDVRKWSSAQIDRALAHIEIELRSLAQDQETLLKERQKRMDAIRPRQNLHQQEE